MYNMASTLAFSELLLLLIMLFSVVIYITYIIHRTTATQMLKLYIVGFVLVGIFLLVDIFTKLALVNDSLAAYVVKGYISTYIAYIFLFFSYQYFVQKEIDANKIISFGLIPSFLFLFLVMNNNVLHWIKNKSVINFTNLLVMGLIVAIIIRAIIFIVQYRNKHNRYFRRRQSEFFMGSLVIPLLVILLGVIEYFQFNTFIMLLGTTLCIILILYLATRYQLLDDTPMLLDYVISNMKEGVVIVDHKLDIVDSNEGFFKDLIEIKSFSNLNDLVEGLRKITVNKPILDQVLEAAMQYSSVPYFYDIEVILNQQLFEINVTVATIKDKKEKPLASLLTFHDITDLQELQRAIEEKNRQLKVANHQLEEHMINVNELYLEQERKKLMDHINDTLGHSMTEVLALLELSVMFIEKRTEPKVIMDKLEDTSNRARETLQEIRESINRYRLTTEENNYD